MRNEGGRMRIYAILRAHAHRLCGNFVWHLLFCAVFVPPKKQNLIVIYVMRWFSSFEQFLPECSENICLCHLLEF